MPLTVDAWANPVSGDWGDAADWSAGTVPGPADEADITLGGTYAVTIGSAESFAVGSVDLAPASGSVALSLNGTLDVAGEVSATGGTVSLGGGRLSAATLDDQTPIIGVGTIGGGTATIGTTTLVFTNGVTAFGAAGQTLLLDPSLLSVGFDGTLEANGANLIVNPGSFANLAAGTLAEGSYGAAGGGTLELPGTIAILQQPPAPLERMDVTLDGAGSRIEGAGTAIEATLTAVGNEAELILFDYDYVTSNALTVAANGFIGLGAATLSPGGLDVAAGGNVNGAGTITTGVTNDGLIEATPAGVSATLLDITGGLSGAGSLAIAPGATLELGAGAAQALTFTDFASGQSVLRLDDPLSFTGAISGFTNQVANTGTTLDAIDLPGHAPGTLVPSFSGNAAGGTLTVSDASGTIASLSLIGDYTLATFDAVSDGQGGSFVELAPVTVTPDSWASPVSGDWGDAADWSTGTVPGPANEADITLDGTYAVTVGAGESFTVASVDFSQGSGAVALSLEGSLGVGGEFADDSGSLGLAGGGLTAGTLEAFAPIGGFGTIGGGTVNIEKSVTAASAGQTLLLDPAVLFVDVSSGLTADDATLITAPAVFSDLAGGTLEFGTYVAEAGGTLELPGPIDVLQQGTPGPIVKLSVDGATSRIESGGTSIAATLTQIAGGGELELANDDFTTTGALTLGLTGTKSGELFLDGSTLTAGGGLTIAASSSIDVGSLIPEFLATGTKAGSFSAALLGGSGIVTTPILNDGGVIGGFGTTTTNGTVAGVSGLLDLQSPVGGTGVLIPFPGGTLELGAATDELAAFVGQFLPATIHPLGTDTVLRLDDPLSYTGTIDGFTTDTVNGTQEVDAIDLPVAPSGLSDSYSGTTSGGTLTVSAPGGTVASLAFTGDYTHSTFDLLPDGHGGTLVELACFARGTRIAATRGEIAVENLRVGDRVHTAAGRTRPIVWIGEREVDCRRHPHPQRIWPVRVRAGAFADGAPVRDLYLSPDHAVFCDGGVLANQLAGRPGVLIPIKHLIDGASIVQERADRVHYFHVELDGHDVLLAEGLPAESYLDTGNRAAFANGGAHVRLHPDFAPLSWENACAPLCTEGRVLAAVRRRLRERLLETSALRLGAGGRVLRPVAINGRLHRFLLPAGLREASIMARVRLGIGGIVANGRPIPLDSLRPLHGCLGSGSGGRAWPCIDGAAGFCLPEQSGPVVLEILVLPDAAQSGRSAARATSATA